MGLSLCCVLAATLLHANAGEGDGRLFGRVETAGGDVYVGFVRWGPNHAGWFDLLEGSKPLTPEHLEEARRLRSESEQPGAAAARTIEYRGVRITWDEDDLEGGPESARSGLRFGHVRRVEPTDEGARLVLASGRELELRRAAAGPRPGGGAVTVDVPGGEEVEVPWTEIRVVELMPAPAGAAPRAFRLHGTLKDRQGRSYTGWVTWGAGGVLSSDELTGGEARERSGIPFGQIRAVAREGRSGRVILWSGETLTLAEPGGTATRSRGIRVSDPGLGVVRVLWEDVLEVAFHRPEAPPLSERLDGGRRLRGTVVSGDGQAEEGWIRWDNDEEYTWELLNGRLGRSEFEVELAAVLSIRRETAGSSRVTLRDGREFELSGSNDVGWGNKGVVLELDDGRRRLVEWWDLVEVRFGPP